MKPVGTLTKTVIALSSIGILIASGVLSQTLAQAPKIAAPSAQPASGVGRYQIITVNMIEPEHMSSYSIGSAPVYGPARNYDKVMMLDTVTGRTWELDSSYGWVATGTAPSSTLVHNYQSLPPK